MIRWTAFAGAVPRGRGRALLWGAKSASWRATTRQNPSVRWWRSGTRNTWNFERAAAAGDRLMPLVLKQHRWITPDELRDGTVMANLHFGRAGVPGMRSTAWKSSAPAARATCATDAPSYVAAAERTRVTAALKPSGRDGLRLDLDLLLVAAELPVERRRIDAEHLGRAGLVAALGLQHPHDVGPLDHLERRGSGRTARRPAVPSGAW